MWFYVQRILIPHERSDAALHGTPRGNLSDLYPRWLGARELLLHHLNPYSASVTHDIQAGYYGRPLDPSRPADPHDEQRFAYPVYIVFLLAPTLRFSFPLVATVFRWIFLFLTVASLLLWLRTLRWKLSCSSIAALILLTLGSFPAIQGLKLQQLSLLSAFLVAAAAAAMASRHLVPAGILLAIATIKPQLVFLLVPWLFLWTMSDWYHRRRLAFSFAATMLLLEIASEIVLPGWLWQFRAAMSDYYRYTGGGLSLLDVLTGPIVGKTVAVVLIVILVALAIRNRHADASQTPFLCTLAALLAVTVVVAPTFAPYNQLLLLPAVLILVRDRHTFEFPTLVLRLTMALLIAVIAWPWIASFALLLAAIVNPAANLQKFWAVPLYTSLATPFAVLLLLFLRIRYLRRETLVPSGQGLLNPRRLP
jgi:hypothetical protein